MKKILVVTVFASFLTTGFVLQAKGTTVESVSATLPEQKPKISELTGVEPKKLTCKEVSALNSVLNMPEVDEGFVGMLLVMALDNSIDALSRLDKYEKAVPEEKKKIFDARVVSTLKRGFLKSLSSCAPVLYEYRFVLKEILKNSLGKKFDYENSLLYKFLQSKSKEESSTFFEKNINKKEDIRSCCIGFVVLFGDLEHTMPSVFSKGRERLSQSKRT